MGQSWNLRNCTFFFTFQARDVYLDIKNCALIACSLLQGYGSGGYALRIEGLKKVSLCMEHQIFLSCQYVL